MFRPMQGYAPLQYAVEDDRVDVVKIFFETPEQQLTPRLKSLVAANTAEGNSGALNIPV